MLGCQPVVNIGNDDTEIGRDLSAECILLSGVPRTKRLPWIQSSAGPIGKLRLLRRTVHANRQPVELDHGVAT